jgi:hypothetical protein
MAASWEEAWAAAQVAAEVLPKVIPGVQTIWCCVLDVDDESKGFAVIVDLWADIDASLKAKYATIQGVPVVFVVMGQVKAY